MLYRIERLVGVAKYQNAPSRWPGVLAICLGLAVFVANTNWAQGQAQRKVVVDEPGVKTDLGKSAVTNRTPVEYPEAALEKKVQGTVVVEATVDQNGAVSDAHVVSGPTELRKAALQSVLEWQFAPESGGNKRRVSISFQTPPGSDQANREKQLEDLRLRDTEERAGKKLERRGVGTVVLDDGVFEAVPQDTDQLIEQLGDLRVRDIYREVEDLKAKLNAARRAQELENASHDSNGDAARREQQALETRGFLEEQLKQAEMQAVEAQGVAQRQLRQQEETQPQLREMLERLRESQQGALREQVSQGAQLTEQLRILQAQMEALRAQAEALKAQLQEQQKAQQK
jgi:TonB family protein